MGLSFSLIHCGVVVAEYAAISLAESKVAFANACADAIELYDGDAQVVRCFSLKEERVLEAMHGC